MNKILEEVKKGNLREAIYLMNESSHTLEDVMREVKEKDEVVGLYAVASRMGYITCHPANVRR